MPLRPTPLDVALVVALCGAFPFVDAWLMRRIRGRLAVGIPGAKLAGYRAIVLELAILAAVFAVAWALEHHPWEAPLGHPPAGWRLAVAVGLCVGVAALFWLQLRRLGRTLTPEWLTPKRRDAIRRQFASVDLLVPHTASELRALMIVSVTAGVCEEWVYRGALTALLATWCGLPIAILVANVGFATVHAYQGGRGMVRTGIVGLVMSGVVLLTGSLLPAMMLHAIVDIGGGATSYRVLGALDRWEASAAVTDTAT